VLLERGDEHDVRGAGELRQHPPQHRAVQSGHADVEEHRVDRTALGQRPVEAAQRARPVPGGVHGADARVGPEQMNQVVQGGRLVVHRQDAQTARHSASRCRTSHLAIS